MSMSAEGGAENPFCSSDKRTDCSDLALGPALQLSRIQCRVLPGIMQR